MPGTPIKITLYEANNEIKQEYSRSMIPWGVLKKAIQLTKNIDQDAIGEKDIDAIAGLIVEAFGSQFTIQELDAHADVGDMIHVLQNIVTRATTLVAANPTMTLPAKKRSS